MLVFDQYYTDYLKLIQILNVGILFYLVIRRLTSNILLLFLKNVFIYLHS